MAVVGGMSYIMRQGKGNCLGGGNARWNMSRGNARIPNRVELFSNRLDLINYNQKQTAIAHRTTLFLVHYSSNMSCSKLRRVITTC